MRFTISPSITPLLQKMLSPIGDVRLTILGELASRLDVLNFRGLVRIESNVGGFCMTMSGPTDFVLAAPDLPAAQCDRIGFGASEAYELGLQQSAAFSNFLRRANERHGGAIRFEIISLGNTNPLVAYPPRTDVTAASAWNQAAASNQRVDILLFPDDSAADMSK